jgi:hypothetical protein
VKFFLDENFPRKATLMLEAHGFEVFDIRGTEIEGADDNTLFEKAQQHEAAQKKGTGAKTGAKTPQRRSLKRAKEDFYA